VAPRVYKGTFGPAQAERLLWRAGFGPRRGEAKALAAKGLDAGVLTLTRPGPEQLVGPEPKADKGLPIAPADAFGHDHIWWLDRMVRSSNSLVERMTLVWHDWFATQRVGGAAQRLMLDQNELFRRHALGSFSALLVDVTKDPAMLLWLNGNRNTKRSPNENYARELMELFTLGADRGYTEADVREQARALTGWRNTYVRGTGPHDFRYDPTRHDGGTKSVFGKTGAFGWEDACRLCLENPQHPSFFVDKLWSYFVPVAPDRVTRSALEGIYRERYEIRPVVEAILRHPVLYTGPRMVKPPVVYAAGLLRTAEAGVAGDTWTRLGVASGQRLFAPPNVAGWDERRWLDTSTFRGRWLIAGTALAAAPRRPLGGTRSPQLLLEHAVNFLGKPELSAETRRVLLRFGTDALRSQPPPVVEGALRQLVAASPEFQTS